MPEAVVLPFEDHRQQVVELECRDPAGCKKPRDACQVLGGTRVMCEIERIHEEVRSADRPRQAGLRVPGSGGPRQSAHPPRVPLLRSAGTASNKVLCAPADRKPSWSRFP